MPNESLTLSDRGRIESDYSTALAALSSALASWRAAGGARSFRLVSAADREIAGVLLVSLVKPGIQFARGKVSPVVKATHAAHDAAKALEHELVDPWLALEKVLRRAMADFDTEQRLAAEIERKRIADEVNQAMQASAAREAATLAEAGDIDGAVAVLNAPTPALDLPLVVHRPVKVAGVSSRPVYRYRILDPDKIKREFLMPDEKAIRECTKAWGESAAAMVGGIEVYQDTIIGGRTPREES